MPKDSNIINLTYLIESTCNTTRILNPNLIRGTYVTCTRAVSCGECFKVQVEF